MCHASCVMFHVSCVMCHVSCTILCVACVCSDNDPEWMEQDHVTDSKSDSDVLDLHPSELVSVRAVIDTIPLALTTAPSSTTPSTIVTQYIKLRITESNDTWHTYTPNSKKGKGTPSRCTEAHTHALLTHMSNTDIFFVSYPLLSLFFFGLLSSHLPCCT